MLTVSDIAAERIKKLLESEAKKTTEWGLRVGVEGGGCSGLQYRLDVTKAREGDAVIEHMGAKVFVDPRSLQYVEGSQVDYSDALTGAGFKIVNPNEKSSCGCGTSFSV
jgi:iron-sulfur cluster assembly accessory protein